MKLLILIISDDSQPVYAEHRKVHRSYMATYPGVTYAFITCDPTASVPALDGDILKIPGHEGYSQITRKTIEAIRWFGPENYDFLLRTNLSSLWILPRLMASLETFPTQRLYAGFVGLCEGVTYVSGAGILISPDVAELLCRHSHETCAASDVDDIAIGITFKNLSIPIQPCSRCDVGPEDRTWTLSPHDWHIRVKSCHDRSDEPRIMREILASVGIGLESTD